ncbi:MAG: hypothetical protein NT038_07005 [Euryarchaeota archaeon]|nr:hypothetical protein [Euryarchaeota archaeon]
MLTYEKLSKKPGMFHTFTGLTPKEFDKIYTQLEQQYPQYEQKQIHTIRPYDFYRLRTGEYHRIIRVKTVCRGG